MAAGGTEAFPDLGKHCQHSDCHQLDFLPFNCDACHKVFCLEHRSYKSHQCSNPEYKSRKVLVCKLCSTSIEMTGRNEEDEILQRHEKSKECDPRKNKKPTCAIKRCKEVLTFSNTCVCKTCNLKVCLKHRFPADHACSKGSMAGRSVAVGIAGGRNNDKFLVALAARSGKDCTGNRGKSLDSSNTSSVKVH